MKGANVATVNEIRTSDDAEALFLEAPAEQVDAGEEGEN